MKIPITCRILYAEDDEDSRFMLKTLLGFAGIEVITAKTVAEAWRRAQSEQFDLYLLDVRFPEGDGLDLCRRLRLFDLHTPIFFYSGNAYETDRKKGFDSGADDYLTKPDTENIQEKILAAIKLSRKNADQRRAKALVALKDEQLSSVSRFSNLHYAIDGMATGIDE